MSTVRLRRLESDHQRLQAFVQRQPRVQIIQTDGTPPERYQIQYQLKGLRQKDDQLVVAKTHLVEIHLPLHYPRLPPQCRMLTPVFHPNIAPHAICIGDHWSAGQSLESIVIRIGEMLAYQSYNTKSPLNGDAARWVAENEDELPLDAISLVPDDEPAAPRPAPAMKPPAEDPAQPQTMEFVCPECKAALRIPAKLAGKQVRCPRCKKISRAPA